MKPKRPKYWWTKIREPHPCETVMYLGGRGGAYGPSRVEYQCTRKRCKRHPVQKG
jgi:hypothetical protein